MNLIRTRWIMWLVVLLSAHLLRAAEAPRMPLPEHPRPDFQRANWLNLNGAWAFRFDKQNLGEKEAWAAHAQDFPDRITVPFPWGSKLSGVENLADIAWYARTIQIPVDWKGQRVFLVVGACDWLTSGWLDGQAVGTNRGGYTPFEFELTAQAKYGEEQKLVLRVDDTPHPFKLEGKQGYGPARGIWQTIYLEARPQTHIRTLQFVPDIDQSKVTLHATLNEAAPQDMEFRLKLVDRPDFVLPVAKGAQEVNGTLALSNARLWSLEDPYLYEVTASLKGTAADQVNTYFGMRKISVTRLPGLNYPYIALNNKPIYLQLALDQAYHPDGFYTFPSDEFMRDEILRSRRIGLNALRLHVKIEVPRKLYWADRLGLLLMADVPNSWGQPDAEMRQEAETALRGMIRRDFNHPSIFSWVIFNETWGLFSADKKYSSETQDWVASMYRLAKSLDATRLVEDNSPCNLDHVVTDINSWHVYLPGFSWQSHLDEVCANTFPGSKWNYIGGRIQGDQPLLNSECGNVWGYEGSAGDVDWSWDYHRMMNEFRRHPKVCGWLYTEHHDVINEWNGYYRFDRSEKETGLGAIVPGMSLMDLHSACFVAAGSNICNEAKPGASVSVPLWASFMTDRAFGKELVLRASLTGWDRLGRKEWYSNTKVTVPYAPWFSGALAPLELDMPNHPALVVLGLTLEDETGAVLHRNFTTFLVTDGASARDEVETLAGQKVRHLRIAPKAFSAAQWSLKQWNVLDGLKVNGAGAGFFEYHIPWPANLSLQDVTGVTFRAELGAKQLFGKDREGAAKQDGDFMRGKGTHDPSLNPNAYPMTDTVRFPSAVRVRVAGESIGVFDLPDDPADHQGILSWHAQKQDRKLREAGSYGYLVEAQLTETAWQKAFAAKELVLRLEVDASLPGGLAIYGERFGRYPLDPTLTFLMKE